MIILIIGLNKVDVLRIHSNKQATIRLERQKPVSETLSIPAIDLHVPIKTKLTDDNMKHYICQENETDYPGMPHNLVLAGHNYNNDKLFSNLDQVKVGQKIIINNYYVYRIDTIKAINAKYRFPRGNKAQITLYTCLKENNPNYRLIIQGHLIH